MISNADQEIDDIAQKIILEIEQTRSKDLAESDEIIKILHLTDAYNAKVLLQHHE